MPPAGVARKTARSTGFGKDFCGSGCGGGELLDGNAVGGQDRVEDEVPGVVDFVAVRVEKFADQCVRSEQA